MCGVDTLSIFNQSQHNRTVVVKLECLDVFEAWAFDFTGSVNVLAYNLKPCLIWASTIITVCIYVVCSTVCSICTKTQQQAK